MSTHRFALFRIEYRAPGRSDSESTSLSLLRSAAEKPMERGVGQPGEELMSDEVVLGPGAKGDPENPAATAQADTKDKVVAPAAPSTPAVELPTEKKDN